jgi:hypothetical protein
LSGSPLNGRSFYLETAGEDREPLGCSYDADADVLYLWRGSEPREALSFPMDSGPLVRLDPDTGELVGVTLIDFSACWAGHERIEIEVPAIGRSEPEAAEMHDPEQHRNLVLV